MFKAILFDLDNTLIDFVQMKRKASKAAINAMIEKGLELTHDEALEKLEELYRQEGWEDQTIFQKFLKQTNGDLDYKLLAYGILAYRQAKELCMEPYPNTVSTLMQLKDKGIKLAIVSDAPKLQAWLRLCQLKLDDFFEAIVALDDTGQLKPSALPFNAAIKELKVKPSECLMIGDDSERDIKGATDLGIKTALAKYGLFKEPQYKADYEINSVEEILEIIK
ncbi:TIGR02253 family HAD-type hydrolase [Nanoarchaeota archaeon]